MTRNFAAPITAIDRIESVSETGVEAVKQIVADDPYLCGHYPDFTIYPGIFTIESVHQAVRKMVEEHHGTNTRTTLASIVSVRLAAPLLPGDTLRVSCARLSKPTGDPDTFRVKAGCYRSDGVMAAQMTLEVRLSHTSGHELGFEHADITKLLPHRFPILLVDKVLELDKGSRIVAIKAVTGSEPCYAGLAEDLPHSAYAFPTSLMVESFGQTGAILWLQAGLEVNGTLIFGAARDCKFEGAAYPGDVLRHVVHIDVIKGDNAFMYGEIWVADRRIATIGSMLAVVRETALLNS